MWNVGQNGPHMYVKHVETVIINVLLKSMLCTHHCLSRWWRQQQQQPWWSGELSWYTSSPGRLTHSRQPLEGLAVLLRDVADRPLRGVANGCTPLKGTEQVSGEPLYTIYCHDHSIKLQLPVYNKCTVH